MAADDAQGRMPLQHPVARRDLGFVVRDLRMQQPVVLGIRGEVPPVSVDGHLVHRQPAVARLAEMGHQRAPALRQGAEDRVEPRIVGHHVLPVGILQHHPDVLPDLDGHGAARIPIVDRAVRRLRPVGLAPVGQVERRRPRDSLGMGAVQGLRGSDLPAEPGPVHAADGDVQPSEVVLLEKRDERAQMARRHVADVGMRVDLGHLHHLGHGHGGTLSAGRRGDTAGRHHGGSQARAQQNNSSHHRGAERQQHGFPPHGGGPDARRVAL